MKERKIENLKEIKETKNTNWLFQITFYLQIFYFDKENIFIHMSLEK